MHTYESFDKEEVKEFFDSLKNCMFWEMFTRIDPKTMKTVFVLKWR